MIKKVIKYVDFNGNERNEECYFNLNEAELIELEMSVKGGIAKKIEEALASEDNPQIISIFKNIILTSYGVKSDDGRRFIKDEELTKAFLQSGAYATLFKEIAQNAELAAEFVKGVLPTSMN